MGSSLEMALILLDQSKPAAEEQARSEVYNIGYNQAIAKQLLAGRRSVERLVDVSMKAGAPGSAKVGDPGSARSCFCA